MTNEELFAELKRTLTQFDSAATAHNVRLAARIDALTGFVLALAQKLGLDAKEAEQLLAQHEDARSSDRLIAMEDRNPSAAAQVSEFLDRWHRDNPSSQK